MTPTMPERVELRRARLRQSGPAVVGLVGLAVLIFGEPRWPAVLVVAYWVLGTALLAFGLLQLVWLGPAVVATPDGVRIGRFTRWGTSSAPPVFIDASDVRAITADEMYTGGSKGRFIAHEPRRWPVVRIDVAAEPSARGRRRRATPIQIVASSDEAAGRFVEAANRVLRLDARGHTG